MQVPWFMSGMKKSRLIHVTCNLCALLGAEGEHDVGGDDGAALEEDRGGGGVVQVGHLQHGRVSVHRHLAQ